jgi:hypothetical protein
MSRHVENGAAVLPTTKGGDGSEIEPQYLICLLLLLSITLTAAVGVLLASSSAAGQGAVAAEMGENRRGKPQLLRSMRRQKQLCADAYDSAQSLTHLIDHLLVIYIQIFALLLTRWVNG